MTPLRLELSAARARHVGGEDVVVDVSVTNLGAQPLEIPDPEVNANWQPVYELRGPGPDELVRFDLRAAVRGPSQGPLAASEAVLRTLAPAEVHTVRLGLGKHVDLTRPGQYTLSARLTWDDLDVESPPLALTIEALQVRDFEYGVQGQPGGRPEVYAAWLHAGADATTVFQACLGEKRPDLGELRQRSVARICEVAADASDVRVPWAGHSRLDDLIGWVFWREGGELCGLPTMGRGALRMTLPFVPALWAGPPLESRDHDVDMFVVGGPSRRTLAMLRIVHGGFARAPRGECLWRVELPEPIVGATVVDHEAVRHLVLVTGEAERVTIRHAVIEGAGTPTHKNTVHIDEWLPHPGVPPALLVDRDGGARAVMLLVSPDSPLHCLLVETPLGPGSAPMARQRLFLPGPVAYGQIRPAAGPGVAGVRHEWALRGVDGATYVRGPEGGPVIAHAASDDPPPLALLVLADNAYLLRRTPTGTLQFERLGSRGRDAG